MPRYFFDVCNHTSTPDFSGTVFPNDDEARAQGIVAAGEMIQVENLSDLQNSDWVMTIKDEAGSILLKLRFSAKFF